MKRPIMILAAIVVLLLLLSSAPPLWAQRQYSAFSEDGVPLAADVLLVRPLGLVSMILGGVGYILTYPFAAVTTPPSTDVTAEQLVIEPARFTFERPLGYPTFPYRGSGGW
jgi:hypothetical protein